MRGAMLVFGVTTSLDMFTSEDFAALMRSEQADGTVTDRAELFSSGMLATAPDGHGTQFGVPVDTIEGPDDAEPWVQDRVDAGADYIKIVVEEGYPEVGRLPTLDATAVEALVDAAHARDLLAITHVHTREAARTAIEAGTDGLAHMFHDMAPSDDLVDLAVDRDVFVVPTLVVFEHIGADDPPEKTIADDPRLGPCMAAAQAGNIADPFTGLESVGLEPAQEGVERLHGAGVPILAGSDAPNPGTAHGASLHREMELLTESGLTPTDALAAATAVPAREFGLDDRGRIAEELRADLVLVEGDPTADILATRAIVDVWKAGVRVDRSTCDNDDRR